MPVLYKLIQLIQYGISTSDVYCGTNSVPIPYELIPYNQIHSYGTM